MKIRSDFMGELCNLCNGAFGILVTTKVNLNLEYEKNNFNQIKNIDCKNERCKNYRLEALKKINLKRWKQ